MSNQVDPLLFWLEQESVNSDADIYLPADTPNDYALSKYNYQLDKKKHMKRHRAIARLKAYELEMITNKRKSQPPDDPQISIPPFAKLETIGSDEFLNDHVKEIIEILALTGKDGQRPVEESVNIASNVHLEERDHNYARSLQIQNLARVDEYEREFARIRNQIYNG
ncbi:hypothetical protein BD408DRAFT_234454 [Parasitella parasitica]|nr:hypothetical protein BD408DRAFT_234454 [Parasitella parasitica]